jgi:nitrogen regulatory protein PII
MTTKSIVLSVKIADELANPAIGGSKIFVVDLARALDLATKEQGEKAL